MMAAMLRENADIVLCGYTIHNTTGKMRQRIWSWTWKQAQPGMYDRVNVLCALVDGNIETAVWNKMYRRELWQEVRFPDGYVYEGTDTTYRIINLCKICYVLEQRLYLHRKRPGSITDTHSWKNLNDGIIAYSHFISFIEANTPEIFSLEQLQKRRQSFLISMLSVYIRRSGKAKETGEPLDEELKRMIIEKGKEIGIENFALRTRAAYWLFCVCPSLLKIIEPLYRFGRLVIYKIVGN